MQSGETRQAGQILGTTTGSVREGGREREREIERGGGGERGREGERE